MSALDERHELYAALAAIRDRDIAAFLAVALQLAIERYPEEMRAAFAALFDISKIEQKIAAAVRAAQQAAQDTHSICLAVEDAARRLDAVHEQMDDVLAKVEKAKRYLVWLRNEVQKLRPSNGQPQPKVAK